MDYKTYVDKNENLESIKPVLDKALENFLGLKIDKISDEILEKLKNNHLHFEFKTDWTLEESKHNFKKNYLMELLREVNGNISKASVISGIDRRTIHRLIATFEINADEFRNLPYHFSKTKIDNYIKFIVEDVLKEYSLTQGKSKEIYGFDTNELVKHVKKPFPTMDQAYDEYEKKFLIAIILKHNKILKDVGTQLKIARETLSRKISKHKIIVKDLEAEVKYNEMKLEELI